MQSLVQDIEELKGMKSMCVEILQEADRPNEFTGSPLSPRTDP